MVVMNVKQNGIIGTIVLAVQVDSLVLLKWQNMGEGAVSTLLDISPLEVYLFVPYTTPRIL
jgi:hypothetical protein